MPICVVCKKERPDSMFHKRNESGGLRGTCKICWKEYAVQRYQSIKSETWNPTKQRTAHDQYDGKSKLCTRCWERKPTTQEFFRPSYKRTKDGLGSWCIRCLNKQRVEQFRQVRHDVLSHYSNGMLVCACCGETEEMFLSIDHIAGGGNSHRKAIQRASGAPFRAWLQQNGYPKGYQILCFNCNLSKGFYGECPHKGKGKQ